MYKFINDWIQPLDGCPAKINCIRHQHRGTSSDWNSSRLQDWQYWKFWRKFLKTKVSYVVEKWEIMTHHHTIYTYSKILFWWNTLSYLHLFISHKEIGVSALTDGFCMTWLRVFMQHPAGPQTLPGSFIFLHIGLMSAEFSSPKTTILFANPRGKFWILATGFCIAMPPDHPNFPFNALGYTCSGISTVSLFHSIE